MFKITMRLLALISVIVITGCAEKGSKTSPELSKTEASKEQSAKKPETEAEAIKTLVVAAKFAEDKGDDIAASAYWSSILENHPFHKQGLLGFARTANRSNLSDRTLPHFYTYLRKHPKDGEVHFELAKTLVSIGQYRPALDEIDAAEETNTGNWQYESLRGIIYDRLERYDISDGVYKKALEKFPDQVILINNYALSLLMAGKIPQAKQQAEKLLNFPKASHQMIENYARILFASGEQSQAEKVVREKLPPLDADRVLLQLNAEFAQPQRWGTQGKKKS